MKLRNLEIKDASYMLEWMHDPTVVEFMNANFAEKTITDCQNFIQYSNEQTRDLNLAIVDKNDEYMGTVSLKHIDVIEKNAEFAITVRKIAMGQGFSKYGMNEILRIGKERYQMEKIVWCVSKNNLRAVSFYDKNGYERTDLVPNNILKHYNTKMLSDLLWYVYS